MQRKPNRKSRVIGVALVLVSVLGVTSWVVTGAQAQPPGAPAGPRPHRMGPGGGFGPGMGLGLGGVSNLSDAQREQIRRVVENHADQIGPLTEKVRAARLALEDALVNDPLSEGPLLQRSSDLGAAEGELAVARGRLLAEISTLLTPEQQQQAKAWREQMKERIGSDRPPRRRR